MSTGLQKINYVDILGIINFLSIFPKENLDVCFSMSKKNFIFRSQEIIENFCKKITESEFYTINQVLVKIILSQIGASNFISNI
jgi:hypothetical protein